MYCFVCDRLLFHIKKKQQKKLALFLLEYMRISRILFIISICLLNFNIRKLLSHTFANCVRYYEKGLFRFSVTLSIIYFEITLTVLHFCTCYGGVLCLISLKKHNLILLLYVNLLVIHY